MASEGSIRILWYAVPNTNTNRGGWMPVYDLNGKMRGDTYGRGYDLETAWKLAKEKAEDEAAHYVGDWDVTVAMKPNAPGWGAVKKSPAQLEAEIDEALREHRAKTSKRRRQR